MLLPDVEAAVSRAHHCACCADEAGPISCAGAHACVALATSTPRSQAVPGRGGHTMGGEAGHTWVPENRGSSLAELGKGVADLAAADHGEYQSTLAVVWPSHCSSFLLSREPEALCRAVDRQPCLQTQRGRAPGHRDAICPRLFL